MSLHIENNSEVFIVECYSVGVFFIIIKDSLVSCITYNNT